MQKQHSYFSFGSQCKYIRTRAHTHTQRFHLSPKKKKKKAYKDPRFKNFILIKQKANDTGKYLLQANALQCAAKKDRKKVS